MKNNRTKSELARTSVIASPPESQFADRPALAALVNKMAGALERRKQKTSWMSDAICAEFLARYTQILEDPNQSAQRDFMRWVVEDARYLAAEGNFQVFCQQYLMAEMDEVPTLWDMAGDGPR